MERYFLTSRHGNCGSTVMFHNKDECGYGTNLNALETYTAEKAQKHHDNFGRDSLPLLVSKVMDKSQLRVDHQYIELLDGWPTHPSDICVLVFAGHYDGNDIQFLGADGKRTFNFDEAAQRQLQHFIGYGCGVNIIRWDYLRDKARPTLQSSNINIRSMCRGVKIQRKKVSSDSGMCRWNCPSCGKLHWQYNPHDFEGCNDSECSEWKGNFLR